MKYYQEITLIDGDKSFYQIWSDVYKQLHIALADIHNKHGINTIGVSFPNYRHEEKNGKYFSMLGNKLRLFAPDKESLKILNINHWLEHLNDYVHIKNIDEVGNKAQSHVCVKRYRGKSLHRLSKDYAKYKQIDYDNALQYCQNNKRVTDNIYPYVNITSCNTGGKIYRLSIIQSVVENPSDGAFNTYGINNSRGISTVPHW